MKCQRKALLSTAMYLIAILLIGAQTVAVAGSNDNRKKLIKHGWDIPKPGYVADNIRQMEKEPFEGVIMRIRPLGKVFVGRKRDRQAVADQFDALRNIEWDKFTDNFLIMYAAEKNMDWFDETDRNCVMHNVGLLAKAADIGDCKGICFDPEPYGQNPWHYPSQERADSKSFAEYEAIVRKCGAEFISRVQKHIDSPVIHTFFMMSVAGRGLKGAGPQQRAEALSDHHYGLLPAFFEGMLKAAEAGTTITDGNEGSYYYRRAEQFRAAREFIRNQAWKGLIPDVEDEYKKHVQVSQALYADQIFDRRKQKLLSHYLEPAERAKWFQHNVYHALKTADEYVWLYTERMNWWKHKKLPGRLKQAVVGAKEKLAKGRPLGYDIAPIIQQAENRRTAQLQSQLTKRRADIGRAGSMPQIDGRLGDSLWKQVSALQPFVPCLHSRRKDNIAETVAWVAYDDSNLYIAVRCAESQMDAMRVVRGNRDAEIWRGDSVDVFITQGRETVPYYHIIVNPESVRWDASFDGKQHLSWNPDYKAAAFQGKDCWSLELKLPWTAIDISSAPPEKPLRANICRNRRASMELSCWSQTVRGFVEKQNFGVWRFQ